MKRAVVSFANTPFYIEKMNRMGESMKGKTDADIVTFTSFDQVGCRPHSEVPYQFKPYSIQKAIEMGYDSILWLDSPIVAIKDITPVFEHIEEHGYLFFNNYGHPLGKWTNDACLDHFGKTRQEALNIKQIMACVQGWDFRKEFTDSGDFVDAALLSVFESYKDLSTKLYPGGWEYHRHDQTVLSFLIDEFGMDIQEGHKTFFIYEHFKEVTEFQPIAESVCLVSR